MNLQYHFQLVFLRLVLKRNVLSESNLRITLLETSKELEPTSNAFQTEEIKIKKNQKIIDLESMKTFNFNATKEHGDNKFIIKYEIKGNSQERVRSIPIHTQKMISEFVNNKKSVFQQSFGGQNAQISYKFYITTKEVDYEVFNLLVTPQTKEGEEEQNETKRSNSINRTKRPPNLNINKRSASHSPVPRQDQSSELQEKPNLKHLPSNSRGSLLALSPTTPQPNKMPFLGLNNLESHEENSSVSGTHKKISSLPLSEIEKVNQLMATHHRPHVQEHHGHGYYLSYKLKIVIVMFIIGIAFLVIDTFSDRKSYNKPKKAQDHASDPHSDHHQNAHQAGHAKAQKKEKINAPKKQTSDSKQKTKKKTAVKEPKANKKQ